MQALRDANRVSAVCHENPDADTIGAAVAVSIIAERLGAETEIVSADGIPRVRVPSTVAQVRAQAELEPNLAVICDAATLERVGRIATEEAEWFAGATVLNIDHHISSTYFGDLNLVDPTAAATCEVLAGSWTRSRLKWTRHWQPPCSPGSCETARDSPMAIAGGHVARRGAAGRRRRRSILVNRRVLSELAFPTIALWGKMLARVARGQRPAHRPRVADAGHARRHRHAAA